MSIKLYLDVGNDEHITLCNFGGRFLSGLVIEGRASEGPPGRRKQKSKIKFNNKRIVVRNPFKLAGPLAEISA